MGLVRPVEERFYACAKTEHKDKPVLVPHSPQIRFLWTELDGQKWHINGHVEP
jgi:hypothetical protein